MMAEKYLFEIPVYSCSKVDYYKTCKSNVMKRIDWFNKQNLAIPREKAQESYMNFERSTKEKYETPWDYNEVVGFIKIYKLGIQIRGETWFISAKRIQRGMKTKIFIYTGDTFEITCYENDSSQDIFKDIISALFEANKKRPFKNKHIDLSSFMNCGPFIDWHEIILSES